MKTFIKRLICHHGPWRVVYIALDGVTSAMCTKCGKIKSVPLPAARKDNHG